MSHSVNIATQFKDIKVLERIFHSRGWETVRNQKCRTYPSDPSRDVVHDYVAVNPTSAGYDVGIDLDENSNAAFTCDFYDRSIEQSLGKNLQHVKQGYSLAKLKTYMHEEDLDYSIERLPTGQLKIIATK
jgi:hypothetical protein